jgi:hypothetical protein
MSSLKIILRTVLSISGIIIALSLSFAIIYLNHHVAMNSVRTIESMSEPDVDAIWAQAEREVAEQERREAARQPTPSVIDAAHSFTSETIEDVKRRQERVKYGTQNLQEFFSEHRLNKMVAAQILSRHILRQAPPRDWRDFIRFEDDLRVPVSDLGSVVSGMAPSGTLLCDAPWSREGVGRFGNVGNGMATRAPLGYVQFNLLEIDPRSRISGASCTDDFWYQPVIEWLPVSIINDLGETVTLTVMVDPKHATPLYGSKSAQWNLMECGRLDLNQVTANRFLHIMVRGNEFLNKMVTIYLDTGIPEHRNEQNQVLPWVIEDGRIVIRISEAIFVRS